MKPLLISSGEPAGIGPDLCVKLARYALPVVVLGDVELMRARAIQLGVPLEISLYRAGEVIAARPNHMTVWPVSCPRSVHAGVLNAANAPYVLELLTIGAEQCCQGEFSALVTAPVNKEIINRGGYSFTGHTEFLAEYCHRKTVVMMLACEAMKVALVTTHLPLRAVPDSITQALIVDVVTCLHQSLQTFFGLSQPQIYVSGLNPHAGEGGYLGREEIDIIIPALSQLDSAGITVYGPIPADTLFTPNYLTRADVFVTMYHDQGLSVLKHAGFHQAVNITLGLPIIRTSVDHGTALELAGTGQADERSLLAAVQMAMTMAQQAVTDDD